MSEFPEIPELDETKPERRMRGISVDVHFQHHQFIEEWIEKEKRKREMADKIKAQVGGWIIITAIGAIGTGAYNGYLYLKDHLK
jgi:hypothetical protein